MSKMLKTEICDVGPKLAERYLALNTYEGQRPFRESRLSFLISKMNDGSFRTAQIALARLRYNGGQEVLMNGQHQLTGIIQTGKTFKANVERHLCDDPEDTAHLYMQFDNGGMRSLQNMLRAEEIALEIEWPTRISNLIASAAAIKEGKSYSDKQNKVELLKKYLNFGKFLSEVLLNHEKGIDPRHLRRVPVVYPMLMSYEKSQEDAQQFWIAVRDGENLKTNMPEYKLFRYLTEISVGIGRGASKVRFKVASNHEVISKCIHAWNAFRRHEPTDLKYFSAAPIPKAI